MRPLLLPGGPAGDVLQSSGESLLNHMRGVARSARCGQKHASGEKVPLALLKGAGHLERLHAAVGHGTRMIRRPVTTRVVKGTPT